MSASHPGERPPAPTSTYRLQMRPAGGLRDAAALVGYLDRLGAGAVYIAPPLTAAPGSTHGYDGVDPTAVDPALGGEPARLELVARLRDHGMALVADIVPNHLSVARPDAAPWWWDLLKHGPASSRARFFDIDWPLGPVHLPVLADDGDGGAAMLAGLTVDADSLRLPDGRRYPIAPGTGPDALPRGGAEAGPGEPAPGSQARVSSGPPHSADDEMLRSEAERVHRRQHYRLVSWREAASVMSYRRFFDISDLAAVRTEDPTVFDALHAEVLRWAERGELDGLRIDHPDGLSDPGAYFARLAERFGGWIVAEKILAPGEEMPASWPVHGTTGYDALREVCGLFIDPDGEALLTRLAESLGVDADAARAEQRAKAEAAERILAAEVRRIAALVPDPPGGEPAARTAVAALLASFPVYRTYLPDGADHWSSAVDTARTLLRSGAPARGADLPGTDGRALQGDAPTGSADMDAFLRDMAADAAVTAAPGEAAPETGPGSDAPPAHGIGGPRVADAVAALDAVDRAVRADPRSEPAVRIQQTSGMVMAKGVEDTAFYRATRFIALNEVGGDPSRFGTAVEEFHCAAARRERIGPWSMTTLSTHDTKRSEDVRARLAAIAEVGEEFSAAVRRWTDRRGLSEPSLNLLAWQTLVGTWPISAARLSEHLLKAARESKLRTSWTEPDEDFEDEIRAWPGRVLSDDDLSADVCALVDRIRRPGWSNSLGQKLLQLTMPGVPDLYQGTELWDFSLVDPDNRRPVDFTARDVHLERLESGLLPAVDATGEAKMHVVRHALALRRTTDLSGYRPLHATGPAASHCVAFARGPESDAAAIATRLPIGLESSGGWRGTTVPLPEGPGPWHDRLTGRTHGNAPLLADVLDRYPVALLVREATRPTDLDTRPPQ